MIIDTLYAIGDTIYLKTDSEQKIRMITGVMFRPGNCILYEVSCGSECKWFNEMECTTEKNVLASIQA